MTLIRRLGRSGKLYLCGAFSQTTHMLLKSYGAWVAIWPVDSETLYVIRGPLSQTTKRHIDQCFTGVPYREEVLPSSLCEVSRMFEED
ncbi:MAG: hypothetical protein E6R03_11315 [Hyphomicrobiaceae bacterium]|nr:MAG: hypothetical protein E6R03_11315 [Hyphomicrobiaceae bacterium]